MYVASWVFGGLTVVAWKERTNGALTWSKGRLGDEMIVEAYDKDIITVDIRIGTKKINDVLLVLKLAQNLLGIGQTI
ncbi:hypothetical protein PIB30_007582 [Stylosanthes scabra]|uniref:Uncharacterized protein n=1 Tax=Stylosanthes scabra TaxID=79078 RepID=A0ABU6U6T1_9FABA|nr:hypothetical protein [Stylosanthes scabra]